MRLDLLRLWSLRCISGPVCRLDDITKMESNNCEQLKQEDDGVRAGGEGNVTACLVFPLSEEQMQGIESCSHEEFEFRVALFLIDDIICGPLSQLRMQYFYTRQHLEQ